MNSLHCETDTLNSNDIWLDTQEDVFSVVSSLDFYHENVKNNNYLNVIYSSSDEPLTDFKMAIVSEKTAKLREKIDRKIQVEYIIKEIISSESEYIKNLKVLQENFLSYLITDPIFNIINYYITNLENIHTSLLTKICKTKSEDFLSAVQSIAMLISEHLSIYFYENYIKNYYIVLNLLEQKNTVLNDTIHSLNNIVTLTNSNNNMNLTFKSLLQVPINRIMKYKIFISKILLDYITESSCKNNVAESLNFLLFKLDKINNFQLDYVTTIKSKQNTKNFNKINDDVFFLDPNRKYNDIINSIVVESNNINIYNFGPIILLQPVIVYYLYNKEKKRKNDYHSFKKDSKKKELAMNFTSALKVRCLVILFKSHLLILEPVSNKKLKLKILFCIPIKIAIVLNHWNDGVVINLPNTLKLEVEHLFLKYEILLACWNNREFENLNSKLKYLGKYYNSRTQKLASSSGNYPLSVESFHKKQHLTFNDISIQFEQFIKPKNISIKDFKTDSMDLISFNYINSYFNNIFVPNFQFINISAYEYDDEWSWNQNNFCISPDRSNNLVIDVNERLNLEILLTKNNMWFSDIDTLKLSQYQREVRTEPKYNYNIKESIKNLIKSDFIITDTISPIKSATTVSDRSLLFLPKRSVLNNMKELRSTLFVESAALNVANYLNKTKFLSLQKAKNIKNSDSSDNINDSPNKTFNGRRNSSVREIGSYLNIFKTLKIKVNNKNKKELFVNVYGQSDETVLTKNMFTKSMEEVMISKK
ncbi:hypothetical protein QEN19_001134 [Hanseniaspora menglaensis]